MGEEIVELGQELGWQRAVRNGLLQHASGDDHEQDQERVGPDCRDRAEQPHLQVQFPVAEDPEHPWSWSRNHALVRPQTAHPNRA